MADIWDSPLCLGKVAASLPKGLYAQPLSPFLLCRVECQVCLLTADWISFESADTTTRNTPAKACSSALNALVLTAALQAGSHVLGHGDRSRGRRPASQSSGHPRNREETKEQRMRGNEC